MNVHCRTLFTTSAGQSVDLLRPQASDIDFDVIAHHLSLINRYGGAAKLPYSVAEHSARGALGILRETGNTEHAAYFLCHDMHEFAIGDAITPLKRSLDQLAPQGLDVSMGDLYRALAQRWDTAIHTAAGLVYPLPIEAQQAVERMDQIMLCTEWRDLMTGDPPFEWPAGIVPMKEPIIAWTEWRGVRRHFAGLVEQLLPGRA